MEHALQGGGNDVEDDDFPPGGQEGEQVAHPDPVTDDGEPLVQAALGSVRLRNDHRTPEEGDHRDEGDVLDLDEEVLEDVGKEREEFLVLRPHRLPHLGVGELLGPVDGVGERVVEEVLVLPPVGADAQTERADEHAPGLIFLSVPENLVVHDVMHDEATLLPEQLKQNGPEIMHVPLREADHAEKTPGQQSRAKHQLLGIESPVGLEKALFFQSPMKFSKVGIGRVFMFIVVSSDHFAVFQEKWAVPIRPEDGCRVLPYEVLDNGASGVDVHKVCDVIPASLNANDLFSGVRSGMTVGWAQVTITVSFIHVVADRALTHLYRINCGDKKSTHD